MFLILHQVKQLAFYLSLREREGSRNSALVLVAIDEDDGPEASAVARLNSNLIAIGVFHQLSAKRLLHFLDKQTVNLLRTSLRIICRCVVFEIHLCARICRCAEWVPPEHLSEQRPWLSCAL